MVRRKDKVVDQLRGGVKQLLTANGVKQFTGCAGVQAPRDDRHRRLDPHDRRETDDHRHRLDLGDARHSGPSTSALVESRAFLALDQLPKA